jgi:hypothetical protein
MKTKSNSKKQPKSNKVAPKDALKSFAIKTSVRAGGRPGDCLMSR